VLFFLSHLPFLPIEPRIEAVPREKARGGIAMRNRIQIALVLAGLLLLSGCGVVGPYEMRGEYMLTLDQALGRASSVYDL
jgi:hypothetical protein